MTLFEPSEVMKARMDGGASDGYLPPVSPLGGPYPELMVQLSDGTTVTESVFGAPPADLPFEDWDEWYADRDEELVTANLGDI